MAQHDMNIANQGFPATRADLNNALQALASNNSGTSAPSTTFANQWWYDEANNKLYIRNEANNAWIQVAVLDQTNNEWQITTGVIQAKDSDGLALKTDDGTTRLFIKDSDGRIGLGTVSPAAGLDLTEETSNTTTRSDIMRVNAKSSGTTGVGFGASLFFLGERNGGAMQGMGRLGFGASTNTSSNLSSDFIIETANAGTPAEKVRVLAAGGLTFNGDTAAANALDDYEEGSWTPAITGVTVTSGSFTGSYRKVGGIVTASCFMSNANLTGSGDVITGFPFANGKRTSSSMPSLYNHQHGDKNFNILFEGGGSVAYMQYNTAGGWVTAPISAGNARYMNFQMTYGTSE